MSASSATLPGCKHNTRYRGNCVVIAGEELFAADIPEEVLAQARAAHPEDEGSILIRYIPREKMARIYMACNRLCHAMSSVKNGQNPVEVETQSLEHSY